MSPNPAQIREQEAENSLDSLAVPGTSEAEATQKLEVDTLELPKASSGRLWREGGANEAIVMMYRDDQGDLYDRELYSKITQAGGSVVFLVSESEDLSAWQNNPALDAQVHFITTSGAELFVRDFFPLVRQDPESGEFALIDAGYGPHLNKIGDRIPSQVGEALKVPVRELKLNIEFGNVVNLGVNQAGESYVAVSDSVLSANPDIDQAEIRNRLKQALGVEQVLILKALPSSGTGHVDEFLQEMDGKLLVGDIPEKFIPLAEHVETTTQAAAVLDENTATLRKTGFEVIRITMPPPSSSSTFYPGYIELLENGAQIAHPAQQVRTHDYNTFANWLEVRNPAGQRTIIVEQNNLESENPELREAYRSAQKELSSVMEKDFNSKVLWHQSPTSLRSMQAGIHCITASLPLDVLLSRKEEN